MKDIPEKLYTFDKDLLNASFFNINKMLIKINPDGDKEDVLNDDKKSTNFFLSFEHEMNHMFFMLGTSQGVYSLLMRFAFFAFVSQVVRLNHSQSISLPFITELEKDDRFSIILNSHRESFSYIYCPFKSSEEYSIINIRGFKSATDISWKMPGSSFFSSILSSEKIIPMALLEFDCDGKKKDKLIPIGLYSILEGYSRCLQDDAIARNLPMEEFQEGVKKRISNGLYLPYYILSFYTSQLFENKDIGEMNVFIAAVYISMMYFPSISSYQDGDLDWVFWINSPAKDLFCQLTQPGDIFMRVLTAVNTICETGRKPELPDLLNMVCDEMRIPPIEVMNKNLKLFIKEIMNSPQFLAYPFIKYFFKISLKVVEKAEKDIITFLRNPIVYLEEQPFIMVGKGIHKRTSKESVRYMDFSSIIEQFLFKKRIFCFQKYLIGTNPSCKNNGECSLDNEDYPYSKCDEVFINSLNKYLGDVNKLVPS